MIAGILSALGGGFLIPALLFGPLIRYLEASGMVRVNHRDRPVPTSAGLLLLPMVFPLAVLLVRDGHPRIAIGLLAAAWGTGAAGLIDDLAGEERHVRGWRGHVGSLLRLRLTGGGRKLLVGGASSLAAAAALGTSPAAVILGTAVIGLSANTLNQLDVRPGRAWKAFLLLAPAPALWAGRIPGLLVVAAVLGAATVMLGPELGERTMLGDAGANALGGLMGFVLVVSLSMAPLVAVAAVLLAGQVITEVGSLGRVIRGNRWLCKLDDWGLDPS